LKSGSLNLLEPLGPAQACNGIALPLPYSLWSCLCHNEIVPFVCYSFTDQLTENYMAWKTVQLGHATGRQVKSWLYRIPYCSLFLVLVLE